MVNKAHRGYMQIMWHLTARCNLHCSHCYTQNVENKDLTWDEFKYIADNIRDLHNIYYIVRVGLLGGEPLLMKNVFDIARYLLKIGIPRVDMATNGTMISNAVAVRIKEAGISSVQISLEAPISQVNDAIRGRGVFQKVCKALEILCEHEIPTALLVTVSKRNFEYIEDIVKFAINHKVKVVSFNPFLPIGRGKVEMGNNYLSPSQLYQMMELIHNINEKNLGVEVTSDSPMLHGLHPKNEIQKGGCGAGIGNLRIMEDGIIYPCRRLPIPVGNIFVSSLKDIMVNNHLLKLLRCRAQLKGVCHDCQYRNTCGGCRASAYIFTGDLLKSDPMCIFNNKGYNEKQ
jgi:radical SAM protein with 4Fe4S-binding SPASM domain